MFRDPRLRKLFIVLAAGYAVLVGAFILTTDKKEPPKSKSPVEADAKPEKSSSPVRMLSQKNTFKDEPTDQKSPPAPAINSKKIYYKGGTVSGEWIPIEKKKGSGTFKAYYPNGSIWLEAAFMAGRLEGVSRTYYPSGVLWTVTNYKNGAESGSAQFFYPNTRPWIDMQIEKTTLKGVPAFYSESGDLRKGPPVSDREGNKYFKVFDARGEVVTQWAQAGGAQESAITTFYENGEKSSQWNVLNANLHGPGKIFYPDGRIWLEYNFDAGKETGAIKSFYSDGSLWSETRWIGESGILSMRAFYPGGVVWFVIDPSIASLDQPIGFFSESYVRPKGAPPTATKEGAASRGDGDAL